MRWTPTARRSRSPGLGIRSWRGVFLALAAVLVWAAVSAYLAIREEDEVAGIAAVIDGDSLKIGALSLRLQGLDAPELAQTCTRGGAPYPCGREARAALVRLVDGGPVWCRISGRDRYRRSLARCAADGRDVGADLVRQGFAVSYLAGRYRREEEEARDGKRGLWAGTFQLPADWRKEHRARGPH